jgi:asparagine synthase (glutamine-hydrolysing)
MCGIFGYISSEKYDVNYVGQEVSESIKHRGPDSNHIYYDQNYNALIGHRRLSIIDLSSKSDQPYVHKNVVMSFNGEIYNYKELRSELKKEGVFFKTGSDTEVLINVYTQWGIKGFQKLNGMFAVSFYDKNINKMILLRDRIGEKPILYYSKSDAFAFSSEAKSFKYFPVVRKKIKVSLDNLRKSIHMMWLDDNESTSIDGIIRVPPASYLILDLDNYSIKIEKYWSLEIEPVRLSYSQAVSRYKELLLESVKIRCRSDCGVSVMLSGGLDSSLISSMMKSINVKFDTYTLEFDSNNSEHEKAKYMADYLGVKNKAIHIDYKDAFYSLKENINLYDDLTTFDPGLITSYIASKAISKYGEKVVILGEGSDEINGGYGKFKASLYPYKILPSFLKNSIVYYASSRNNYSFNSFIASTNSLSSKLNNISGSYLQKLTGYDIQYQLPNHLLMKVDRATMAYSLEARVPFLDHNLVEFIYNLPDDFKLLRTKNHVTHKRILQDVAREYLPKQILSRKKFGMMLPIGEFISENKVFIGNLIVRNKELIHELIPNININRMLKDISNHGRSTGSEWLIWRFIIVIFWVNYSEIV